jgi:hypothetical protein
MRNVVLRFLFLFLLTTFLTATVSARSGCCSHHGGVSGCGCADGTPLSSTCAPYYPECNGGGSIQQIQQTEPVYIAPTSTPRPLPTWTPKPTKKPTPTITSIPTNTPVPTQVQPALKPVIKQVSQPKNGFIDWIKNLFGLK